MQDMIDFRCSPTFQDGYYEQGLTPRHSPEYRDRTPEARMTKALGKLTEMVEAMNGLTVQNQAIIKENERLRILLAERHGIVQNKPSYLK